MPESVRQQVIEMALERPELSPRARSVTDTDERGYVVSEARVDRLLKAQDLIATPAFRVVTAADECHDKTTAPHQLWQTDFTYLKVIGWGWLYLSTILDDYSRYVVAWKLCTTMTASDVTDTLEMALAAAGLDSATVRHRPRLRSDNGSSYIAHELGDGLEDKQMAHTRGAPYHPLTQGKIELWHQTMKNRVLLAHYYLPGDLEAHIHACVDYYHQRRYHERLRNVTLADVYFGRAESILRQRAAIKQPTMAERRLQHVKAAA